MVQILPPKTSLGTQFGQSLQQGLTKGTEQGINRGMLQGALKQLENLPANSTPLQLASKLMETTAGIPGSERYVGSLFPLLMQQMQSRAAFPGGQQGNALPSGEAQQNQQMPNQQALNIKAPEGKGLLSGYIQEPEIYATASQCAESTGTGIQGYNEKKDQLERRNATIGNQRSLVEKSFLESGGKQEDLPLFMQLANRAAGKTGEEVYRNTKPLFSKYRNLTHSLEDFSYPGIFRAIERPQVLSKLQGTVKDLVNLGFEDRVRETLTQKGLSPTEVSEVIHPLSKDTLNDLKEISNASHNFKGVESGVKKREIQDNNIRDFLKKHTNKDLSLLGIRNKLTDKGYDWERVADLMREVYDSPDAPQLSIEQIDELETAEKEPPRQSLGYLFQDIPGHFWKWKRGEK